MKRLLILTEAGDSIGMGHLTRCQAIFEELGRVEAESQSQMFVDVHGAFNISGPGVRAFDWRSDIAAVAKMGGDFDAVLIDSYLAEAGHFEILNDAFRATAVIDDFSRLDYAATGVLNPNPYFKPMKAAVPHAGGKDFVILRSAILQSKGRFQVAKELKRGLLTLGGDDVRNLVPKVVDAIGSSLELEIVAPMLNPQFKLDAGTGSRLHGRVSAEEMSDLMTSVDIAISACGQTLHELAFLGVPTIGILVGDDQQQNMDFYADIGFLQGRLRWDTPDSLKSLADAIESYRSYSTRIEKCRLGWQTIDGKGVSRIGRWLDDLLAG